MTGLDQPEPGGVAAVLEEPVPGRELDVTGRLGEDTHLVAGHAAQEGVGGQSRRADLSHVTSPPSVRLGFVRALPHGAVPARAVCHLPAGLWPTARRRGPRSRLTD